MGYKHLKNKFGMDAIIASKEAAKILNNLKQETAFNQGHNLVRDQVGTVLIRVNRKRAVAIAVDGRAIRNYTHQAVGLVQHLFVALELKVVKAFNGWFPQQRQETQMSILFEGKAFQLGRTHYKLQKIPRADGVVQGDFFYWQIIRHVHVEEETNQDVPKVSPKTASSAQIRDWEFIGKAATLAALRETSFHVPAAPGHFLVFGEKRVFLVRPVESHQYLAVEVKNPPAANILIRLGQAQHVFMGNPDAIRALSSWAFRVPNVSGASHQSAADQTSWSYRRSQGDMQEALLNDHCFQHGNRRYKVEKIEIRPGVGVKKAWYWHVSRTF